MINSVTLLGRMGADPELRYTQTGKAVVSFNLAVTDRFKKDHTNWISIVAWNQLAELITQYCKKGSQIALSGRLQQRSFDGKDGKKVYVLEVVADNVQFLDTKPQQDKQQDTASKDPFDNKDKVIDISDDDLPF